MAKTYTRLTSAGLKNLSKGTRLTEHGISVERTADNDLRYTVAVMVDGQRIHRVIGRQSEGVTRSRAEIAIETLRSDARADRLNLPTGRKTHRTFGTAASEYLERMDLTGGKDLANKKRHLAQQLVPFFGDKRLDKINISLLDDYRRERLPAISTATLNRELATLSHLFNRAVEWGWLPSSAKPSIRKHAEPRKRITILDDEQCRKLMDHALLDHDDRMSLFIAFGLNAAMRHSEIVSARYDNVDFVNRRLFIPSAKAGMREQPLTPFLAAAIAKDRAQAVDKKGWIFPALPSAKTEKARNSHRPSMEYGFKRVVMSAGLNPAVITPHVMRHTAITRLVKAGVDLPTIQRISGHKTLAMVLRYTHIHGQHIDKAMAALDFA